MEATRTFSIMFDPAREKSVARYVVRGFFGVREFPQAVARMILTAEFVLFVGIPILLLLAADFIPAFVTNQDTSLISECLTLVAVVWLIVGLLRIGRYGRASGIGCYVAEPNGTKHLVGGLRMRLDRRSRRVWIAGLLVEPEWRGSGIATALMLAAFRLAEQEALHAPLTVAVFAPTHPASRAIVAKHLGGLQVIEASNPPSTEWSSTKVRLEQALLRPQATFEWHLPGSAYRLL